MCCLLSHHAQEETRQLLQERLALETAQATAEREGPRGLDDINTGGLPITARL